MKGHNFVSHQHWGIVTDHPPEEVDPTKWTAGQNIQFQDQATVRVSGYEAFAGAPSGTGPYFAMHVLVGPNSYWIYCTANKVFVTDGTLHFDITPAGGLQTGEVGTWTGCILNGIPVLSNGEDAPFYWNLQTGNKCLTLPGWPVGATCKVIRAMKYHLFALNIFDGGLQQPDTVWWSQGAAPGAIPQQWTPSPSNDAGDMTLADSPGGIVDGLSLRDTFVVYKQFATYMLSYVAGQYVFTQRKLFLTTGLQTSNCVAELNGEHWLFTGNDVIRHDGQNFVSVVQDKIKHDLVQSVDPSKTGMCCVTSRHREQQLWVCIPTQGQPYLNRAYVINVLTGDCGVLDLPLVTYVARGIVQQGAGMTTWDTDPAAWDTDVTFWDQQTYSPTEDSILICDADDNKLWAHGTIDTIDGQPMYAFVERQSLPINDNILRALTLRVLPRLEGEPGEIINIRVGGQAYFNQPITWSDPQPFVIGQDVGVNVQTEGRLISVRFEGTTARVWKLHSYKMEVVDLGLF